MDSLQSPSERLLYLVSDLSKKQEINDDEKSSLKEMIINDEPQIFSLLDLYGQKADDTQLRESIVELVRPKEKKLDIEIQKKSFEPPEQDDVSSPLGNSLFERKKRHSKMNELQGLAEALKSTN
mmetsp:Transcript_7056/g.7969  ORF Transcript_7056/g.7969 Transcript_7056/m.7969 type:complete len:124 (-) Transcript_7056:164-535(-)